MTATPRVTVELLVEWGAFPGGALAIAIDDSDTIAGSIATDDTDVAAGVIVDGDWEAGFTGTYDDLSSSFLTAEVGRGRDDLLTSIVAGRMLATVRDRDGLFNHANTASPLYGQIDDRLHPVKLRLARAGAWRTVFYGFTRRVRWEPSGRRGVAVIECVDLFYRVARAFPIITSTGPTTTGAAIGFVLDTILWIDPAARTLDTGDDIPDFSADGSRSALELIGDLLTAERGVFYIAGDGRAVYEDRHARLRRTSEATITDRMVDLAPEVDFDLSQNRVRVSMVDGTGTVTYTAEAIDEDSRARIGYADLPSIQTTYLADTAQADALADWILPLVVEPTSPIHNFTIDGREDDLLDTVLDLDLIDRFTISEAAGGSTGDFHVERLTINIDRTGRAVGNYVLSRASSEGILAIATDDSDTTAGSIATDDTDTAAGVIVY